MTSSLPPRSQLKRKRPNLSMDYNFDSSNVKEKSPVVVFAHGAGASSSSDWMIRWRGLLKNAFCAVEVVTFDYPYICGGKKRAPPPKAEKLVEFHADIVRKTVGRYLGHPLILVGKSMGSRVSCMVANQEGIDAFAVVCLGYPLMGRNGAMRDESLLQLTIPIMFVQGSKDVLCPADKLEGVVKKMKSGYAVHMVEGGDHSLMISKKKLQFQGCTQHDVEIFAARAISTFVSKFNKCLVMGKN